MNLIFTKKPGEELLTYWETAGKPQTIFVTDSNTCALTRKLALTGLLADCPVITVPAGDENKNLESLTHIWKELQTHNATRKSLIVNIGGGMITDLGGFAAATFKRGLRFVNIPTTILAAVDAATGGKTGINFAGLKNEIGCFRNADHVIISDIFYSTLPAPERLSGYGEMLKHALLSGEPLLYETLKLDILAPHCSDMLAAVKRSVQVKKKIVDDDPYENGLRKSLNLGHTAAHAYESLAMAKGKPIAHGIAVAWGLITDLVLSKLLLAADSAWLYKLADKIAETYPAPNFTCDDYPQLLEFMRHDKKNASPTGINFTLLRQPGQPELNCIADTDNIVAALDITRDLLHC